MRLVVANDKTKLDGVLKASGVSYILFPSLPYSAIRPYSSASPHPALGFRFIMFRKTDLQSAKAKL
jgi:hypothetical protein